MVANDDKSERPERIKTNILDLLDEMKVNRKRSYSQRMAFLLKYCNLDKKTFNKWLEKEDNERK